MPNRSGRHFSRVRWHSAWGRSMRKRSPRDGRNRTVPLCQSTSFTVRAATSPARRPSRINSRGWRGHEGRSGASRPPRQHPLDVFGGDGAGQGGVRPLADGRHGAVDAGWNHTAGGEEAQKRPGRGDRAPPGRRTEPVGLHLHERRDRRHGEPGPVGRRRPRALGKKSCGIAPVHPPGPDDQAVHRHEVIVEALQPVVGLPPGRDRPAARRHLPCPPWAGPRPGPAPRRLELRAQPREVGRGQPVVLEPERQQYGTCRPRRQWGGSRCRRSWRTAGSQ